MKEDLRWQGIPLENLPREELLVACEFFMLKARSMHAIANEFCKLARSLKVSPLPEQEATE